MPTTTQINWLIPIEPANATTLHDVGEYLELQAITVISSHVVRHRNADIATRIYTVETIDCEGDRVPMLIHKIVTPHYTEVIAFLGGQITTLPQDSPFTRSTTV